LDDPTPTDVITFPGDQEPAAPDGESEDSRANAVAGTPATATDTNTDIATSTVAAAVPSVSAADVARRLAPNVALRPVGNAPGSPEPFAGEICVSVSQARREAVKHGHTVQEELLLYLVHGWLHLTGLDDHSDEDILLMRASEHDVLSWLRGAGFKPGWGA
jgi:rRNA maturation RNase YbeY